LSSIPGMLFYNLEEKKGEFRKIRGQIKALQNSNSTGKKINFLSLFGTYLVKNFFITLLFYVNILYTLGRISAVHNYFRLSPDMGDNCMVSPHL
jgi:hypothetical protein